MKTMKCSKKYYKANFQRSLIDQTQLFEAYERVQRHADRRNGAHRRQRDLTNCPVPTRSYKIPRALLTSFTKFIVEMKTRNGLRTLQVDFAVQYSSFQKAYHMKTKATASCWTRGPKSLQYMVPELGEMWAKLRNAKFISKLDLRHGFLWQNGSASWKSSQNELFMRIWNISIPRFANGPHHRFSCFSALGARTPQET